MFKHFGPKTTCPHRFWDFLFVMPLDEELQLELQFVGCEFYCASCAMCFYKKFLSRNGVWVSNNMCFDLIVDPNFDETLWALKA